MNTETMELRDSLVRQLENFIHFTEDIFLKIGNRFPELLEEIEANLSDSFALVDSLRGAGTNTSGKIQATLHTIRNTIESGTESIAKIQSRDNDLFVSLERGIESLSSLDDVIEKIRDDSVEMEIISLNAMTVALKAGQAGRAFSYITEELKRLSTRTITLTENITQQGINLLVEFNKFRQSVENIKEYQSRLFGEFRETLYKSFEDAQNGLERVISALTKLVERSGQIREPLLKIMESVQLQDIIRQSTEHVIIALNELKDLDMRNTPREQLDTLKFFQILPQLSIEVLVDVQNKLKETIYTFKENFEQTTQIIEDAEKERLSFIDNELLGTGTDTEKTLEELFNASGTMLKALLNDTDISLQRKQKLSEESRQLLNEVDALAENFKAFSVIVSRFHTIDIASRIEVAKQDVLQKMTGTIEEMTNLTGKIESDVEASLEITKRFIQGTSSVINKFRQVYMEDEKVISQFSGALAYQYNLLFNAKTDLSETITRFSLFTDRFFHLFRETQNDLLSLEKVTEQVDAIRDKLSEIREDSISKMQPLLDEIGNSEWEIESEKLKAIIDRFTIFAHKKNAGDIAGIAVEEGVGTGEVTLF